MEAKNYFKIDDQMIPMGEVELHLPDFDGSYYLYLSVSSESGEKGFFLWDLPLPLLEDINQLDGRRIHIQPDGINYDDDTTGADILAAYGKSDLNYWHGYPEEDCSYGEIQVDFTQIKDMQYRVKVKMTLTDSEEDPEDLGPEDFNIKCQAEFTVTIDRKDPYSESLKTSENVSD